MNFLVAALAAASITMNVGAAESHIYPGVLVVDRYEKETGVVFGTDPTGNKWSFFCDPGDDWEIGDLAAVIFHDMETEGINDDVIIDARYSGYID